MQIMFRPVRRNMICRVVSYVLIYVSAWAIGGGHCSAPSPTSSFQLPALRLQHHLDTAIVLVLKHRIALGRIFELELVCNHERWVDLAALNAIEQRAEILVNMRLAHFEGQALAERRADWHFVEQAAVDAGKRNRAALAAGHDRLA